MRTTRFLRPLPCPLPSCFLQYVKFSDLGTNPVPFLTDQKDIFHSKSRCCSNGMFITALDIGRGGKNTDHMEEFWTKYLYSKSSAECRFSCNHLYHASKHKTVVKEWGMGGGGRVECQPQACSRRRCSSSKMS